MTTSPFTHEKRRRFSEDDYLRFFLESGGKCANCKRKIPVGENWVLDHNHALCRGGDNDDANIRVLCSICHGAKTSDDLSESAKMKRIYKRQRIPAAHRRKSGSWGRWR